MKLYRLNPLFWVYFWVVHHFVHHDCDAGLHDRFVCIVGERVIDVLAWTDRG